jgi:hypothetical protein
MKLRASTIGGALLGATAVVIASPAPALAATVPAAGIPFTVTLSGLCMSVTDGTQENGAAVVQSSCGPDETHNKFKAVPQGDGTYQLIFQHSGKCVNIAGASIWPGAIAEQNACSTDRKSDRWRFRPVTNKSTFQLVAEHSGHCLTVREGKTDPGVGLIQWNCSSTTAAPYEQFTFPPGTAAAVTLPTERDTPVVAIQGSGQDEALSPISYVYTDNLNRLRYGLQKDPENFDTIEYSGISGNNSFAGPVAVGVQADGRVQVVGHNKPTGDVWLATHKTKGLPTFGDWQDVGGANPFHPTVARMPDGKLTVFSYGPGGSLWFLPQDGTNTPYAGWRSLGGSGFVGMPTIAPLEGGVRIFGLNAAGELRTATFIDNTLSDWTSIGGTGLNGTVAVVTMPGWQSRLFVRAADGSIVTKQQLDDGAFETTWATIGGFASAGAPAALMHERSGRIVVMARNAEGFVRYVAEREAGTGEWGTWSNDAYQSSVDPTALTYTSSGAIRSAFVYRAGQELRLAVDPAAGSLGARKADPKADAPKFEERKLPKPPQD